MDMLTKQLSQMATTLNEICGYDGRILATIKMPYIANISKITLRSGKDYDEPLGRTEEEDGKENSEGTLLKEGREPFPQFSEPQPLDPEPEGLVEEVKKHERDDLDEGTSNAVKRLKSYPYRGEPRRFIKHFIARKAKADWKIVIAESVSARLTGVSLVDTKVVIQLVDRSCTSPEGVLENVIVRIHDFLYPTDFHVIRMNEYEAGESSGVLLGRPFLRTAKTIIDVSDVQEFLETRLLQKQLAAAEMNDSIEKKVSGWCETLLTQNMTDEEINDAIMGFCQKPTSAGSTGFAQLSSLEKVPDFGELAVKIMEKNPLPQEAVAPKKELKTLPQG
ncbi:uncharacterized protein LOC121810529 [Salvia splendens]|uniref:uncharacterized protein LOC121810529 n=1 Tax=Salvia splendens TaxID=180675 RepID=UPI001C277ECF|nr:uncharacterized protein LOC121810529 [Salvia splendens]